jgi:serine/threonine-protein kinase
MTDPQRFREIDALFDALLDLPEPERSEALDRTCASDAALRAEVEALFASLSAAESVVGENVAEFAAPLFTALTQEPGDSARLAPGETMGAWRLVREIGRGGMGTVYLAERADGTFERQAAIKVVRRGMDTAEVLRRFHEERRILASLEHANIARLLDAGETADGRPFLVMEHIEGERIDRWCDNRQLALRERVRLFRDLCDAVHQAHRRLIVHRDIKPSNVLVTPNCVLKLLDFGIAKLLESDTADQTLTEQRPLTPEYAAPEQVSGEAVTTATDVYALGRVLYELLAGVRPFPATSRSAATAPAGPPPAPSQAIGRLSQPDRRAQPGYADDASVIAARRSTAPERLRHALRGDLDTIVLRAMAEEPARRYGSALQLAEDLDRWLDGRPVSARPDSAAYRLTKFVRRNPIGVAAGSVFFLLLIVFAAFMTASQRRTAAALARAQNERNTAEEVAAVLEGLFSAGDPTALRPERLDTFRVAALMDRSNARIRMQLARRPFVQARLLRAIGDAYLGLGMPDSATSVLRDAIALQRVTSDRPELAKSLNSLALAHLQRGRAAEAETLVRESLGLRRAVLAADHHDVIESLANLAAALHHRGDFEGADSLYTLGLTLAERSGAPDTAQLTTLLNGQSILAQRAGKFDLAAAHANRVLELDRARLGPVHARVALDLAGVGYMTLRAGRLAEADSLLTASRDMLKQTVGEQHPMYFAALAEVANVRAQRGRYSEARDMFVQALAGRRRHLGSNAPEVAITLSQYSDALFADGALNEALNAANEAHAILQRTRGPRHPNTAALRASIARIECRQNRFDAALAGYREALDVQRVLPPTNPRVIETRSEYASCVARMRAASRGIR